MCHISFEFGIVVSSVENCSYDLVNHRGGGSGGYLEHVIRFTARELYGHDLHRVEYKTLR